MIICWSATYMAKPRADCQLSRPLRHRKLVSAKGDTAPYTFLFPSMK